MEFFAKSGSAVKRRTACAIVGIFAPKRLSEPARTLNKACDGAITRAIKQGDITGELGETLILNQPEGLACSRLLLVGCGDPKTFSRRSYRKALSAAMVAVKKTASKDATCFLSQLPVEGMDDYQLARYTVEKVQESLYEFTAMKSERTKNPTPLRKFNVGVNGTVRRSAKGVLHGAAIAAGVKLAKDLGNLPSNVCTPTYLGQTARDIAKQHDKLSANVLSEASMKKLGMRALLSVTSGSAEPAKLIVLEYRHQPTKVRPVVMIGKGITFDSGGISMKPAAHMEEMKYDMGGAASLLGVMQTVASLDLPINLTVLIPTCENKPDGGATNPGDIVKTMSGQTVEIINTDAEGRLILCDTLTYSRRFKPAVVIDVATLTGACVVALGDHTSGLLSNDDELARDLQDAGDAADDPAWRLPMGEDYQRQLQSHFADFSNVGGRAAGAITAACFLSRFANGMRWAHLDVAGTAWTWGRQKGGTGRPIPLLVQYLLNLSGAAS